jgi:hypothetical protein
VPGHCEAATLAAGIKCVHAGNDWHEFDLGQEDGHPLPPDGDAVHLTLMRIFHAINIPTSRSLEKRA